MNRCLTSYFPGDHCSLVLLSQSLTFAIVYEKGTKKHSIHTCEFLRTLVGTVKCYGTVATTVSQPHSL